MRPSDSSGSIEQPPRDKSVSSESPKVRPGQRRVTDQRQGVVKGQSKEKAAGKVCVWKGQTVAQKNRIGSRSVTRKVVDQVPPERGQAACVPIGQVRG